MRAETTGVGTSVRGAATGAGSGAATSSATTAGCASTAARDRAADTGGARLGSTDAGGVAGAGGKNTSLKPANSARTTSPGTCSHSAGVSGFTDKKGSGVAEVKKVRS